MPRILVLDDSETRFVIASLLECDGYPVTVCAKGSEALKLQKRSAFDVLITDIFMPDKDGVEVIREFRQNYPETRIVAMSGVPTNRMDYLKFALEIGADKILRKPFDAAALKAALTQVLATALARA